MTAMTKGIDPKFWAIMYRLATCFWVSIRTASPQGLSVAPFYIYFPTKRMHERIKIIKCIDSDLTDCKLIYY